MDSGIGVADESLNLLPTPVDFWLDLGCNMGSNLPQKWTAAVGTEGTDFAKDQTTIYTGAYSLRMIDTAVATELRSELFPWIGGGQEYVTIMVQQDDITAGNTITVEVYEYDADRVTSANNGTIYSGVLPAANTWTLVGGRYLSSDASTKFLQIRVKKAANAFNVYWDHIWCERLQPSFQEYLSADQTNVANTTWTTIEFDANTTAADGSATRTWFVATSSGVYTIRAAGSWSFSASALATSLTTGTEVQLRLKATPSGGGTSRYRYGQSVTVGATGYAPAGFSLEDENLEVGDTVEIQLWHNEGSPITITAGTATDSYTMISAQRAGKM